MFENKLKVSNACWSGKPTRIFCQSGKGQRFENWWDSSCLSQLGWAFGGDLQNTSDLQQTIQELVEAAALRLLISVKFWPFSAFSIGLFWPQVMKPFSFWCTGRTHWGPFQLSILGDVRHQGQPLHSCIIWIPCNNLTTSYSIITRTIQYSVHVSAPGAF